MFVQHLLMLKQLQFSFFLENGQIFSLVLLKIGMRHEYFTLILA